MYVNGLDPVGAPHAYEKQPCAVYDDPCRGDELRDGWAFRVGTWNVESLTGRSGELVEALGERRIDIACVQEIRWRGSSCRYFGTTGKRAKGISCFGWKVRQKLRVLEYL